MKTKPDNHPLQDTRKILDIKSVTAGYNGNIVAIISTKAMTKSKALATCLS